MYYVKQRKSRDHMSWHPTSFRVCIPCVSVSDNYTILNSISGGAFVQLTIVIIFNWNRKFSNIKTKSKIMYSVIRNVLRSPALKSCAVARTNSMSVNSNFVRTFSLMSKRLEAPLLTSVGQHGQACTCGCNVKFLHTKGKSDFCTET